MMYLWSSCGHLWTEELAEKLSFMHCSQFICQGRAGEFVLLNTCSCCIVCMELCLYSIDC